MNDRRMPKNHRNHNLDADIDSVHDETRLKITLIEVSIFYQNNFGELIKHFDVLHRCNVHVSNIKSK